MALAAVITAVRSSLAHVAPLVEGKKKLGDDDAPPRYTWVRIGVAPSKRKALAGSLQEDAYENAVHCYAKTEADAEAMRAALIRAVRTAVLGRNYLETRSFWVEDEDSLQGVVLVVSLTIYQQMIDVTLPADPAGAPAEAVTPNVPGEVQLEDVEIDGSGAVPGDGELQGAETP